MPMIKTGDWLKEKLKEVGMSQKELARRSGLSLPCVSKIISGERYGSPDSWDKIINVIGGDKTSYGSTKFIEELKEEIELYGESEECIAYYVVKNGNIVFVDYALYEDLANPDFNKHDLDKFNSLTITLKEALELFGYQNRII